MTEINNFFSCFCHQAIERSPQYEGDIFPVCFRCAGIYFGIFSTYVIMFISKRFLTTLASKKEIFLISLLFLPLMIDGLGNALSLWQSTPSIRSVTGLLAGIFLATVLIQFIEFKKSKINFVSHTNGGYLFYPFIIGITLIALLLFPFNKIIFVALSYCATAGLIFILVNIFLFWKYYKPELITDNI